MLYKDFREVKQCREMCDWRWLPYSLENKGHIIKFMRIASSHILPNLLINYDTLKHWSEPLVRLATKIKIPQNNAFSDTKQVLGLNVLVTPSLFHASLLLPQKYQRKLPLDNWTMYLWCHIISYISRVK